MTIRLGMLLSSIGKIAKMFNLELVDMLNKPISDEIIMDEISKFTTEQLLKEIVRRS